MPRSDLLFSLLESDGRISSVERAQLESWWLAHRVEGEDLPDFLARNGLLSKSGGRTLDLIRKGFLNATDIRTLLTDSDLERLRSHLTATRPANATTETRLMSGIPSPDPAKETISVPIAQEHRTRTVQVAPARSNRMPEIGDVLGKCLLTGVLGRGGHGIVFSALHQSLNISVAVKVLFGDGLDDSTRWQLRREAQLLARLNHPNVTRVLDYDDEATPYAILELVEGPSLADTITMTGRVPVTRAAEIVCQAAEGLRAAVEFGIVHRDIKPGNILLAKNGVAKIADLGLAMAGGDRSRLEKDGGLVGTCAYVSPEQARAAREIDFRSDIYSLGATFYHAIAGRPPFEGRSAREMLLRHATEPVRPPCDLLPEAVDRATSDIIVRMLAKSPEDRFGSYDDLIADLRTLGTSAAIDAQATPPMGQSKSGIIGRLFQFRSR